LIRALGSPFVECFHALEAGLFLLSHLGTSRAPGSLAERLHVGAIEEGGAASLTDTKIPFVSAAVLVLIAYLVRLGLSPVLGHRSPWLLFTVAIVVAAGRYGVAPGLLGIALSLVLGLVSFVGAGDWSALPPESVASLFVFLATGASMLVFAAHLKASQERTLRLQSELQQAHTQSAVGAMASTLAHELNQPLAAASNYIAACKRLAGRLEGEQKEAVVSGLAQSEAQIHRTGEIIRHARDLVRNLSTERERMSLKAMVERAILALRAGGTCEGSAIRTDIERGADEVTVNPTQIEQVLMNLLRNACQAAADGAANVTVAARTDGEWSTVVVRDRSGGIRVDRLKDLFSAELGSANGGLGLGLAISRTIVEAHGGRIWAENNKEGGASFLFRLPRAG
jgi:signal transduction histidine kinase